ncbi:hypothetical protein AB0M57_18970 [Streptomyces sp. NPDC051597]|uniref:hypothetical protein n=1 Tax=Streptomyces sp. NPDC051597 TaxID=3155049 RepID=UPI003442928E
MTRSGWTRTALSMATAAVVVAGAAGCGGDGKDGKDARKADGAAGAQKAAVAPQSRDAASRMLAAAYRKTAAAKSAKVRMTMTAPASLGEDGGRTETSGVMAWNPTAMDLTVTSSVAKGMGGAAEKTRMLWVDNVMYLDTSAMGESVKEFGGKRWFKFDLTALAKQSGEDQLVKQMTAGMENMNQDPAQQLALLLGSPNLKHLGAERADGVSCEHYKGTLTVDEMVKNSKMLDTLPPKDREQLLTNMKKTGIKGYDTEVWVNADGYPVRMDVAMNSPQGRISTSAHYADYGTEARITAPAKSDTADLAEMLKDLGDLARKDGAAGGPGGV